MDVKVLPRKLPYLLHTNVCKNLINVYKSFVNFDD